MWSGTSPSTSVRVCLGISVIVAAAGIFLAGCGTGSSGPVVSAPDRAACATVVKEFTNGASDFATVEAYSEAAGSSRIAAAGARLAKDSNPTAVALDIQALESLCSRLGIGITKTPDQVFMKNALGNTVGISRAQAEATEPMAHQLCRSLASGSTMNQAAQPLVTGIHDVSLRLGVLGASVIAYCPQLLPALGAFVRS